eukprot:gene10506-7295_t
MQVSLHNKVKTFNLTAGKSLPEWLAERQKNKKNASENRVELIHDLEFPHSARCIWRCPNGTHLFAAGDYPYRLKCFDVTELSMKYSFNADMNILSGVCLSSDYRKFALRGEGRQITVHHSAAIVDRVRVPHAQRCLAYNKFDAELLSAGASPEIHRINLETGAFAESYKTDSSEGVNHVEVFQSGPVSGVMVAGCCNGCVEAWDSRAASRAGKVRVADGATEVRHIAAEEDGGMLFACGTSAGEVLLFDIRLSKPLLVKNHMNGLPIVKSYFFQGRSTSTGAASFVLSADTRAVKVWNKTDGANFTSVEAPATITDFCVLRGQHNMVEPFRCDDSGVLAICCDTPRVQVHFIPQLGAAPRWATFLENLTEELEEKDLTTVYDDYTFISKEELDRLGLSASDMADGKIRPAMHGAFIENGLFRQLKAVVDPPASKQRKTDRWGDRISRFKHAFDPSTAPSFQLDRSNPEYAKLLTTIEERRKKASERRRRYDSSLFDVVPDTEAPEAVPDATSPAEGNLLDGVKSSGKHRRAAHPPAPAEGRKVVLYEVKPGKGTVFEGNDKSIHSARKKMRAEKLTLEQRLQRKQRPLALGGDAVIRYRI